MAKRDRGADVSGPMPVLGPVGTGSVEGVVVPGASGFGLPAMPDETPSGSDVPSGSGGQGRDDAQGGTAGGTVPGAGMGGTDHRATGS